ncbi:MAG: hypothetical protein JSS98_20255 [Bacteroidetes bacterium]|nr:hypothetical protein [Bacteroidota bacterium]
MNYREFVKANYHKLPSDLSAKEKIKKIAELWKTQKGKGTVATVVEAQPPAKISETLGALGLGMHKQKGRRTKPEGGNLAEENPKSVSQVNLSDKLKKKYYNHMIALEKKLHQDGKLTNAQHNKLKAYHHLHGAGVFDILSGIQKGLNFAAKIGHSAEAILPMLI